MTDIKEPIRRTFMDKLIWFFMDNPVIVGVLILLFSGWGLLVAPFDWEFKGIERDPVPVDAIPDIGENQQIVFTEWMGRSPQDIEDQITYPLTAALMGVPGVQTVRSHSFFGFSSIYLIFNEDVEFYWSRSRILEKLNSLPSGTLPGEVQPALGPDATALGQIYWYTLEGRDKNGNPTGGWDPQELRTVQDWQVRYALLSAGGVAEVASVGGYVKEYQVDVDPDALLAHDIGLDQVFQAVRMANLDVGARNIEINNVEYFIRGLGFIKNIEDIENSVIKMNDHVPIYVRDVARVSLGPAQRRGALDNGGSEAVGGVVVARFGENPLAVIKGVESKIASIAPGLPRKILEDGTESQVTIVPFYNRSQLIGETLDTLNTALSHEILVTIIVVLLMVMHLRSSLLISGLLPLSVLMTFIAMKQFGVDANIVALSGIAIAIGTMVDMGIVIVENILKHLAKADKGTPTAHVVFEATREVGSAVLTAVATTVLSFLPVFTMEAAEGRLFRPLAFTKTFALISAIIVSLAVLPAFATLFFAHKEHKQVKMLKRVLIGLAGLAVAVFGFMVHWLLGLCLLGWRLFRTFEHLLADRWKTFIYRSVNIIAVLGVGWLLTHEWMPLGPQKGLVVNYLFVAVMIGAVLLFFQFFQWFYPKILGWALAHRYLFLSLPVLIIFLGFTAWQGFDRAFSWLPTSWQQSLSESAVAKRFPALGREFMPPLDEGAFLYMPTVAVHASIDEVMDVMSKQDMGFNAIPEVDGAVGKLGRAETPLDPAPVSMIETIINYKSQFLSDEKGRPGAFKYDKNETDFFRDQDGNPQPGPDGQPYVVQGKFIRDENNRLIPQDKGMPFSQWRLPLDPDLNPGRDAWEGIRSADDIWKQIVHAGAIPGATAAPKLQPIATRIIMLQTGMRAPIGVKVKGKDLASVEEAGLQIEKFLKEVPSVDPSKVFADRIIGKPYLEIEINRNAIARYGIRLEKVQEVIEVAIGGKSITSTVEGRERYQVRVRYPRERRDDPEKLSRVLVKAMDGAQVPLSQLAKINYIRGPQVIKSEDTFLVSYVILDKRDGYAEVDVAREARAYLEAKEASGEFVRPAGVEYYFTGNYKNEERATKKLFIVLPLALVLIFLILYLQFKAVSTTGMVFSAILVAWSGGFLMIWCYGQPEFLNFHLFGVHLRELFQVQTINMSVAIWVGFLALFGIATDDGVIIASYLDQSFEKKQPQTVEEARLSTIEAGKRRVRPALMTSATTVIALLPILTSTGKGADIMVPMAIPTFGGMTIVVITIFVVPVLYCWRKERLLK